MIGRCLLLWALVALCVHPSSLGAQDTLIVIRQGGIPSQTAQLNAWAVEFFNAPTTERIFGPATIGRNARYTGDVAVYGGPLVVEGRVDGRLVTINADVEIRSGAYIGSDVVVLGGTMRDEPTADVRGTMRSRDAAVPARREGERLQLTVSVRDTTFRWERRRPRGRGDLSILLGLGGTYNRVEGLPLRLGAKYVYRRRDLELQLRGYGVFRTAGKFKGNREDIGYNVDGFVRFGYGTRLTLGGRYHDVVTPTQGWPLELIEVGWGTFLWHRDYRDYFLQRGGSGFAEFEVFPHPLRLRVEVGRFEETSIVERDPWTPFRGSEPWRENPAIDEGDFTVISAAIEYDRLPHRASRRSGWYARLAWDRGTSDNVIAQPLPPSVRDALPTDSYTWDRGSIDLRRYQQIGRGGQFRLRAFYSGTLGSDPLPIQRRHSIGGPDPLNGYEFGAFSCNGAVVDSLYQPALCDRVLLFQVEYRGHLGFEWSSDHRSVPASGRLSHPGGWGDWWGDWDEWFRFSGPTLVLFSNAGTGWLQSEDMGSLNWDIGAGLEIGTVGFYVAKALREGEPVRVTLRIKRRF